MSLLGRTLFAFCAQRAEDKQVSQLISIVSGYLFIVGTFPSRCLTFVDFLFNRAYI